MNAFLDFYREHSELFYNTQLVLAMFGMGATTTIAQFREVFRRPADIGLVLGLQFLVFPCLAVGFAWATRLDPSVAVGLVLLTALPSGSLSNIMTFLGRGNVPLSVTATCASTAVCLVATPLVLELFASRDLSDDFVMPLDKTVFSICLLLILPMVVGMIVGSWWHRARRILSKVAVWGSLIALAGVWVGALGGGQIEVLQYGWRTPGLIALFILLTLLITTRLTSALRYQLADTFTQGIEVSMRNGNLGLALLLPLFGKLTPDNLLHQGSLYTCLFGGGAMTVIGLVAVARRHMRFARQRRAGVPEV